jgi:hypothetical protein
MSDKYGPWKQHHEMRDCVTFEGKYGEENLFLENAHGYYACQNEDHARLISSAPDLLNALHRLVACYSSSHSPVVRQDVLNQAKAAILKAEGK